MKKKFVCMFLMLALTLGMTSVFASADTGSTYSTSTVGFTTKRISDTKAAAGAAITFSSTADKYTVTITLQKKSGSSWVTATDVTGNTIKYTGSNKASVLTYDEWTVKKGVVYRIKCVSVDEYDRGSKYTSTSYSDLF
ncbi:hypothetical protein [Senimuribacter intestinalis]|uniref:hypothetical protein n=1 Tax=Senimuribacter intestinalis TaxID=2941507 RepID=UPI00203B679F|nr:hypothetical protein [Senimuribacter intestinalis]